jgi:DNA-binding CsgD family transcriptional regulator
MLDGVLIIGGGEGVWSLALRRVLGQVAERVDVVAGEEALASHARVHGPLHDAAFVVAPLADGDLLRVVGRLLQPPLACRAALVLPAAGGPSVFEAHRSGVQRVLRTSLPEVIFAQTALEVAHATAAYRLQLTQEGERPPPEPESAPSCGPSAPWAERHRRASGRLAARMGLSRRQSQVLLLLAFGYEYKEVAEELLCSPATIKRHVHRLYTALGVSDRRQILACVLEQAVDDRERPESSGS